MCECLVGLMRVVVIILAIVCAIVGLLTLIGGIIAKSNTFLVMAEVSTTVFMVGLIFGLVMMLFSFAGIYGVVKGRRCCIFLFCFVLGILALVLIALVILIAVVQSTLSDSYQYIDCANTSNTYLQDLEDAYSKASTLLCRSSCPCNYQYDHASFSNFHFDVDGPVNVVSCPDFDSNKYGYASLLMLGVENAFKCTGVCADPKPESNFPRLFYFSNINNSDGEAPNKQCQADIWNFLEDQIGTIKTIMLIVMIVALVSFVFIVVLFYIGRGKSSEWSDDADERLIQENHHYH